MRRQQWSTGFHETRSVPRQDQATFGPQFGEESSLGTRGVRMQVELALRETIPTSEEIPKHGHHLGRLFGRLCQGHGCQAGND